MRKGGGEGGEKYKRVEGEAEVAVRSSFDVLIPIDTRPRNFNTGVTCRARKCLVVESESSSTSRTSRSVVPFVCSGGEGGLRRTCKVIRHIG